MGVSKIKYALRDLQGLAERLEDDLKVHGKRVHELISILIFLKEGNIDLENALKDIDSIYESELIFNHGGEL